jgi:hypothetical protein
MTCGRLCGDLVFGAARMRAGLIEKLRDLGVHAGEFHRRFSVDMRSAERCSTACAVAAFFQRTQFAGCESFLSSRSIRDWTRRTASN